MSLRTLAATNPIHGAIFQPPKATKPIKGIRSETLQQPRHTGDPGEEEFDARTLEGGVDEDENDLFSAEGLDRIQPPPAGVIFAESLRPVLSLVSSGSPSHMLSAVSDRK
ncbi:MAG: hypothetical protein Q9184_005918 [Pyrenodesmia sp. 2 TL-2023]